MNSYEVFTDQELISALKSGNQAAFEEIYERNWTVLYRSAYNVLREEAGSLDVVQEVFIWFWEHRERLEVNSIKGYLLTAVKYKVANYLRSGKVRASFYEGIPKVDLDLAFPNEALEVKELSAMIRHFTEELPDRCKEVFRLSRQEYLTNKEIAVRLGITEKTVENQINKAIKKLKNNLGRFSVFLSL